MRTLIIALQCFLIAGCTLAPYEIQKAPRVSNLAVVFDIDGTLTPTPLAIFTARKDAATAARTFANAGYKIIYLSARVKLLQSRIPGWLQDNGFPEGSIHVPQSGADSADHAAFKSAVLSAYLAKGWQLAAAFGDSSSDFEAYHNAGIPKAQVFALRRDNEDSCQTGTWSACWYGWTDNLAQITQYVNVVNE